MGKVISSVRNVVRTRTKLLREATLGEQGLLQSLCSFLPSALTSAVFKAKDVSPGDILRIAMTLREEVKNKVFGS